MPRSRWKCLILAAFVGAPFVTPSPVAAQSSPPCAHDDPPDLVVQAPPRLAFGRDFYWSLGRASQDVLVRVIRGRVAVRALDPSRPIANPYADDSVYVEPSGSESLPLRATQGDGPLLVEASWEEAMGFAAPRQAQEYCGRSASAVVQPVVGRPPEVDIDRDSTGLSVRVVAPNVATDDCSTWSPDPVSLEVQRPRQRGTLIVGDACGVTDPDVGVRGSTQGPFFRLTQDGIGGHGGRQGARQPAIGPTIWLHRSDRESVGAQRSVLDSHPAFQGLRHLRGNGRVREHLR